jgi:uncharacterized protein (DUF1015 family)
MEIRPFKAFRFNAGVVGDVGKCIAPPYDVISDDERDGLCGKSKYNIVHVTKGRTAASDDEQHNQYTRAAEYLQNWIAEGALRQDDQDTIYGYIQEFEINDMAFQRLSFIALGKLEDFGKTVRPHEQVFAKPLLDRLSLERATAARFGLVFMLYEDPEHVAEQIIRAAATQEPLVDFVDGQGVQHWLFAITGRDEIQAVEAMMRDKSCIIADGHHRYTVGLTYMRESGNPEARYQMMAFANTRQRGLVVLATHRLVGGLKDFRPADFLPRLGQGFRLEPLRFTSDPETKKQACLRMIRRMQILHDQNQTNLGMYLGDGSFYVLSLPDRSLMAAAAPDKSDAWRSLDVAVLQKLVLERLLGLDEEKMGNPEYVEYVKDVPDAMNEMIDRIDTGRKQIAFFAYPVRMEQLTAVADAGERMPHKSTYFYPKMFTGLTIQKL